MYNFHLLDTSEQALKSLNLRVFQYFRKKAFTMVKASMRGISIANTSYKDLSLKVSVCLCQQHLQIITQCEVRQSNFMWIKNCQV